MTTIARSVSYHPRTGNHVDGPAESAPAEVETAVAAAVEAFPLVAATPPAIRQAWLEAIARELETKADELCALADEETALGDPRLSGELAKCAASARFYGTVATSGHWVGALVDTVPGPVPTELRRANVSLGPVAVFGASNFPFGFGVLGHDTCSAIAAGCSVVVKAHPAHPRLSFALAELATTVLREVGAPDGTFGLVSGFKAGLALVDAPAITAVAFTGSRRGGLALVDRAVQRERPIPVFAEMGTVNPVVVTPSAAAAGNASAEQVAAGFVASFTLGHGQLCTKPGLLLAPEGSGIAEAVGTLISRVTLGWLLTQGIADSYRDGLARLVDAGATALGEGKEGGETGLAAYPAALRVDLDTLQPGSFLLEECFGPVALVAEYASFDDALAAVARLQPSLAGGVMTSGQDDPDAAAAVETISRQVGRVVADGWPTGVATSWGMHHSGPWPATSRPDASSVGSAALLRFTRPVCFQNVPQAYLPAFLRDDNPWGLPVVRTGR
ncbi:aldehyde dehydrogenase family protein [Dactylosporangium roseum]|uniref:Aldehyde dehydrogenase family protein n=1 Tax=Dactylosporangium roseum TaxID=47989 RepID=A0ABY5ZE79_9ACTN|nr:aldehyde dehydrogenase family protein [Dactylosporangium roseum]UWZ39727.1 aldehyde dehydrogenase family protein [Dactylosporangium roseum]